MKTYITHDNGGRPFKVTVDSKNNVKIYKWIKTTDKFHYESQPLFSFKAGEIFLHGETEIDKGNSILLRLIDNIYVFIGERIYGFRSLAPIIDYYSIIGNSDVPYPWAIDNKGNFYLMIENVILINKKDSLASKLQSITDWARKFEPYIQYYDNIYMTNSSENERVLGITYDSIHPENVIFLTKLYKKYELEYPVYYYDFDKEFGQYQRYNLSINTRNFHSGYLIDNQGKKLQLNADILKDMINSFKNYLGVMNLEHKILQKRLW